MRLACLGVDAKIYFIKDHLNLVLSNEPPFMPIGYEKADLPTVKFIECKRDFESYKLDDHPLRKALFKYLAAKAHNIVEKQRPQDVAMDEAITMVREALRPYYASEDEIEKVLQKHFSI